MNNGLQFALLPGTPGPWELLLLFAIVLVLFGPKRLPGIARQFGRMTEQLRRAAEAFRTQLLTIEDEVKHPEGKPSAEEKAKPETADGNDGSAV